MRQIMSGEMSPVMIAAIIIGLRVKKETDRRDRRRGAGDARVRDQGRRSPTRTHLVDIVGTGGDGSHTFNISTCVDVRRRGGRRAASPSTAAAACRRKSGSADVLEALGANIDADAGAGRATASSETGIGFMFAPNHHPAMKNVAPVRKELGVRTIFNILGPAHQPGRRAEHADGRVPSRPGRHPGARAAAPGRRARAGRLRPRRHGRDLARRGDDGRRAARTARSREYEIHPEDFGLPMVEQPRRCKVETPQQSKAMLLERARQPARPARDIVVLNAGAALYAASVARLDRRRRRRGARGDRERRGARPSSTQFVAVTPQARRG